MLWLHSIAFGVIALFDIIELGLIADWRGAWTDFAPSTSTADYIIFCSVWTLVGLLGHWAMPFIVAGVWSILTCFFWLVAAGLSSSRSCTYFSGVTLCFREVGKWQAVEAFAWLLFLTFLTIPFCFWWHVQRNSDATWRDGIYGRNFFWKKKDASAGVGLESTMAESNKPQTA